MKRDWLPTISDCTSGAVKLFGIWHSRELAGYSQSFCGCGCGEWVEPCFFCKKPTLSCEARLADKGNNKYRYSCLSCSQIRDSTEIPLSYTP